MGAYSVYSDKPFKIPKDKLHHKRKRGILDQNIELLEKADNIILDMKNEKVLLMKDGKVINDDFNENK